MLFCLLAFLPVSASLAADAPLQALAFRAVGDKERIRAVVEFDRKPEALEKLLLSAPHRLVIDLPETVFAFSDEPASGRGMLEAVRYGLIEPGHSRIIFSFDTAFVTERIELAEEVQGGYRLVIDVVAASQAAFDEELSAQIKTSSINASTAKGDRLGAHEESSSRTFTIVIDPGHGGIDPGAKGRSGTIEKSVTLAFAEALRDILVANRNYRVVMTRDADQFLRLDERVRIARQNDADLLISIHADTIRYKSVRGATVYTISDRASDSMAAEIAESENRADDIAGMPMTEDTEEVADILIDLARRETQALSVRVAQKVVDGLGKEVKLINNPHRYAGFRVLRAPDVPSVLLELGYLSNVEDEALLRSPEWRQQAAEVLARAIQSYSTVVQASAGR